MPRGRFDAIPLLLSGNRNVAPADFTGHAEPFAQPHGIEAEKILESGPVVDGILSAAERSGCDLIVMGAYGHSRVRELIVGSTTDGILRKSAMPVLLYR